MMRRIILMFIIILWAVPAVSAELNGWIKGDTCWVVQSPNTNATIVGIIKKKAAVTVKRVSDGWLKIIFAPVRDPKTGEWIECEGCYIQEKDFSTKTPNLW